MLKSKNKITVILFIIYLLLLIGIVLFKLPFYSPKLSDGIRTINFIPFYGSYDENGNILHLEIIYNILIFIPLGIYISLLKENWSFIKKALTATCLSLSFEVIQFIFAIGRTDITDILDNTLGGIIGIFIISLLSTIFKKRTIKIVNLFSLLVTIYIVLRFSHLFYLSHFTMLR